MRNTFKIILILILTLSFTDLKAGTLLDSLKSLIKYPLLSQ